MLRSLSGLSLMCLAVLGLSACERIDVTAHPPLSGADVFFNGERLSRIVNVELADRAALLKEYTGQVARARLLVARTVLQPRGSLRAALGHITVHGRASRIFRGHDVVYALSFDDPEIRHHKVSEAIEVEIEIVEVLWQTRGSSQWLHVNGRGKSFRRLP